jgi:6,7-dimethyl-8-ribityllumazine synthase
MKISQSTPPSLNGKNLKIAIVLCRYNDHLGNELLQNTQETLLTHGVITKNIEIFRIPGALEAPLATQFLAEKKKYDAIITLGLVIKGSTAHFEHVCTQSYRGLMDVSLQTKTPIIFGILTVNNEKQAIERVSKKKLHKGKEYAEAAIEMATLLRS